MARAGDPGYAHGMGIVDALASQGLTTLRLARSAQTGAIGVTAHTDWDPDADFAGYGSRWGIDRAPCTEPQALGNGATRQLLAEGGAGDALQRVLDGMNAGQHELVTLLHHHGLGVSLTHYVHSSTRGLKSGFHGVRAGGIRRHDPGVPEADVLADGLNLSRAMSYKCAWAELPYGGSKTTVACAPIESSDARRLGFLAYCIDRGHVITGPDVGFPPELIDRLSEGYTRQILCGPEGPLGHTAAPTAEGVFVAIRAAAAARWGTSNLEGRSAAIQGLGAVGLELAQRLSAAGMRLSIADTDAERVKLALQMLPSSEVVEPERVLFLDVDLVAPCALGGVLTESTIAELQAEMVYGSANNQLAARSIDEELALAERIAARGILWQPDFTVTLGGVVAGHEEYAHRDGASLERVHAAIARLCGAKTAELLSSAARRGMTPARLAYERVRPLVHPALTDESR